MVAPHHISGTATLIYLLSRTDLTIASPLYSNDTGAPIPDDSLLIHSIAVAGSTAITTSDGETILPTTLSTPSNTTSSTFTGDPIYGTIELGNSVWQLFQSKTLRPTSSISWASSMPEVEKCWSDIVDWRDSSISWWNKYIASSTFSRTALTTQTMIWGITETTRETTIYPSDISAYTLCDGSARVDARPETRTTTFNVTSTSTNMFPKEFEFPQSQPCIPDPKTCRLWYYESNINVTNRDELYQQCGHPTGLYEPCIVSGGPVQLIYWPEENDKGGICPNNASLPFHGSKIARNTSTVTLPDIVTALGHTFTSGSVYLSFHTLYASYDGFYDKVGPTFKDTIIPVPSSAMFTHCGGFTEAHGPGTSLHYADLNWPVAASAYNCQARCDYQRFIPRANRTANPTECQTIWSDVNPNIAIPTMVKDLVPEWAHCEMSGFRLPNFWFDPPVKLTKRESIVVPTTSHIQPTSEPAAPSSGLTSPAPLETGLIPNDGSGEDTTNKVLPSDKPSQQAASSTGAMVHETGSQAESLNSDHAGESNAIAFSRPPDKAHTAEVAQDAATPTLSDTSGDSEDPTTTLSGSDFTGRFTYQPQTSSLNALSVLESALSALSESGAAPPLPIETSIVASIATKSENMEGSVNIPWATADEAPSNPTSSRSVISHEPIQTSEDLSSPIVTQSATQSATQSTRASFESTNEPSMSSPASHADSDTQDGADQTEQQTSTISASTDFTDQVLPSVIVDSQPEESTLVAGDLTLTVLNAAGSSGVVALGAHTLHPDDPVATVSGHLISAAPSGLVLVSSDTTVTFSEVPEPTEVQLAAGTLTVTVAGVQGSPDAISVRGTTLAEDGDIITLDGSQTLSFGSSGIVVVRSDTTMAMSSISGSGTAASLPDVGSSSVKYPTETSVDGPAEGGGMERAGCALVRTCIFAFAVIFVML